MRRDIGRARRVGVRRRGWESGGRIIAFVPVQMKI